MTSSTALLLLADGRFPGGGHAQSGGLEMAVTDGRVQDLDTLSVFLDARLRTAGLCDGALATATFARAPSPPWAALVAEADARTASPTLRSISRRLGRQLLRAAGGIWPSPIIEAAVNVGPPHPVAYGAVGIAAGLALPDVALLATYHAVTGPASAAVRLLGIDPVAVQRVVAGLDLAAIAEAAALAAVGDLASLPGASAVALELAAELHSRQEVRLFAS